MKKVFILLLALIILISCVFVSCSGKGKNEDPTDGLDNNEIEYGFEDVEVTDDKGKTVTDANGNPVTTQVAVVYVTDKNKNVVANVLDNNGNPVTDKNGNKVSIKITTTEKTTTKNHNIKTEKVELTTTTTEKPTATTKANVSLTAQDDTTKKPDNDVVPKTTATGKEVNFSAADQAIIKSMLEVPYLYLSNYENSDGVPIDIAAHTAVWMAEHEGNTRNIYPSSPVVLNLFKFYGQTVVNFKSKCNDYSADAGAPISYKKADDTFEIKGFTSKKQTVTITKIEDLGNDNYYKVTGTVEGCNKKNVVAVVQKNKLDVTLGFSIKALNWS